MNAKLTKVVAMASLAAFLTVGIGANVAQAKDYHFKIGENHRMVKNDDGTVDSKIGRASCRERVYGLV